MKKPTGRRPTGNVIRMTPKADDPERPSGTVLIDRVYHGKLGQFEDGDDERRIEDSFVLDCEEEKDPPGGDRPDATTALVGASFDAATTPDQRRRLRHNLAMCAIVHVPSTAWVTPISLYFRCTFGARWLQQTRHGPNAGDRAFSTSSASVALALSAGQSVVGIAADLGLLPQPSVSAKAKIANSFSESPIWVREGNFAMYCPCSSSTASMIPPSFLVFFTTESFIWTPASEKRAFFLASDSGPAGTGTPSLGNARTAPGRFVPSAAKRSKSFPGLTDAAWCFSIASRSFSSGSKFAKNGGSAPRMGLGSRRRLPSAERSDRLKIGGSFKLRYAGKRLNAL